MDINDTLPILLAVAWLLPLCSFALILFLGPRMGKAGRYAGHVATGAILAGLLLSLCALWQWLHLPVESAHPPQEHAVATVEAISGQWYLLGEFGSLKVGIGYYIDSLTIAMFCMVTLVGTCIHFYSVGYMHEELKEVTDPLVTLADGRPLVREGRYHRFFQYMSLFCFSMLGLVIAGNIAMVFVFWELVGICSYFLIGFYIERKSASNAANKAFIVNRVGDFGMIIGLMALWAGLGTFSFGDVKDDGGAIPGSGIFSMVRPDENHNALIVPDGMVLAAAHGEVEKIVIDSADAVAANSEIEKQLPLWREQGYGYWLLVIAGLGIFCGCVGKSAQFPLHVWLPDAMEGPTPVSALIHAATMVAAGVYLVGRFFPVFTPEVLLVIAYVGCITLFVAATIAITATDIKRVLAYSTVSQLGYMMLALGLGGWVAGMLHLLTHAFFKSLLFLCSGSVIHACGTNEMPQMGGLRHKMPWTAYTMLVGCLAIAGAGVPLMLVFGGNWSIGLSGYHSKDAIVAQALSFKSGNPMHGVLFYAAVLGAAITAFYMFRLWYMTFTGEPRDKHVAEHAHESPRVMTVPLVILATFAVIVTWNIPFTELGLVPLLEQATPEGTAEGSVPGLLLPQVTHPAEHVSHQHGFHVSATLWAYGAALAGFTLATAFYGLRKLDPEEARRQFPGVHRFLLNKWWFDELYHFVFVRPVLTVSGWIAAVDRRGIDWLADNSARVVVAVSRLDDWIDRTFVDAAVNLTARWTFAAGMKLRTVQTGSLRQYVMWLAVGTVALFVLVYFWSYAIAGT